MSKKNNAWRHRALHATLGCVFAAALLELDAAARADEFGVQLAFGLGDHHVKKTDLGLVWDPDLTWWHIGDWHFALIGEAHAAWWHTDEGNVHENIGEFGVTPVIRFLKDSGAIRPFVEVGAGVRLLTSPRISSTFTLGTALQFAEMAGVGVAFGSRQQYLVGYRFQHVSNGGIKEPNPGINFSQLYLQCYF